MAMRGCNLMGYGPTLAWPTVRAIEAETLDEAEMAAEAMLRDEPHWERVEIWAGGACRVTIHRSF